MPPKRDSEAEAKENGAASKPTSNDNVAVNEHASGRVKADSDDEPPKKRPGRNSKAGPSKSSNGLSEPNKSSKHVKNEEVSMEGPSKRFNTTDDDDPLTDIEELEKASKKSTKGKGKGKGKENAIPKRKRKYKGLALPSYDYPARNFSSRKFIGAHVSISESIAFCPERALKLGGKAFGLFTKNQKTWTGKPIGQEDIRLFKLRCEQGKTDTIPDEGGAFQTVEHGDGRGFNIKRHVVPHGSYLTNLCNPDEAKRNKSYENFLDEVSRSEALGIGLFNIHPGSTVGNCTREESYAFIADCINKVLTETEGVTILLENMAHKNNCIGFAFADLAAIIALVEDKSRIGVCFDTCHAFAAGYDLRSPEAYAETWQKFDEEIGVHFLKAFHMNDSMKELGSHRDLHENIGAGELGLQAFHNFMRDPRWDDIPFILETPMLSGSLRIEAGSSRRSAKQEENTDLEMSTATLDVAPDSALSAGASTWKKEIELLHAMEEVPVGQTSEKVQKLHGEIMVLVNEARKVREAADEAKKEERKRKKEAKALAKLNGESVEEEPKKKGKRGRKVKVEEGEVGQLQNGLEAEESADDDEPPKKRGRTSKKPKIEDEEDDELASEAEPAGCDSHGDDD